jgi:electron transport complex protein RnfB
MEKIYEQLQEKIDRHPMGAPRHPAILALLRELFTLEEACLALTLSFSGLEAEEIAKRAGVSAEEAVRLLESLASRGAIYCVKFKGNVRYALMPPMPGFFEFSLVKGEETPETRRMGDLWEDYFSQAMGEAMHNVGVPISRVIPVEQKVPCGMEILPYEKCAEIVKASRKIALGQCQCRFSARKCNAPLDVCLLLGGWAEFLIDRKLAGTIEFDQAIEVLRRAEEAGLVHTVTNSKERSAYICNCCSCCCFMLRGVTELKYHSLASSSFLAGVDTEECIGCEVCIKRCPFKAIQMSQLEKAQVVQELCYGCGLCSSTCPTEAISLRKREGPPEPYPTGRELLVDIAKNKNKLDSFISS